MRNVQRDGLIDEDVLVKLIQQAQTNGNPAAFEGLYQLYADRVFRYLLARVGDRTQAEELTAQVFLRLLERIGQYRLADADNAAIFSAWLYRVARNLMLDMLRTQATQARVQHISAQHSILPAKEKLVQEVELRIDIEHVMQTLSQLSENQRQVIVLRFLEELSIAETAKMMQKSEGAIKALQHRALANLRHLLRGGQSDDL